MPEKGAALFYGEKHCGLCHAVNGSGGRVAPDLSGQRPTPPAVGWLVSRLWNHQPGMARQMRGAKAAYPRMNQEEMAHMLAFLYQAETVDSPGNGASGNRVFEAKGCIHCHPVRSVGGTAAPDLSSVTAEGGSLAWTAAMWNHAQSMIDSVTKELGKWPQFTGNEMNDLIAFVSAGRPPKPQPHGSIERGSQLVKKDCGRCHMVNGDGGGVGPSLGPETDLPLSPAQFSGVLWNHAPAMMRQAKDQGIEAPKLQTGEIADVLAFLASLRYVEPPGSAEAGEHVFADRGCAHCHGAKAEGLRSRSTPYTAVSFAATMWSHGPKMQARVEEMGMSWPVLEATDVGNFISFLNARP